MKRSMNDAGGDYNAKRRSTGGMINDMRVLLPSQVIAYCIIAFSFGIIFCVIYTVDIISVVKKSY